MKILVIGSGGREHTLCWKTAQSPLVEEVFCAPGNGGIAENATCVDISVGDFESLIRFAKDNRIDLSIVGPEAPLADGIVDAFSQEGLAIFGPDQKAARLEGSKAFAKEAMKEFNIPSAAFEIFNDPEKAKKFIADCPFPVVVKADGLAAGKGVIVTQSKQDAIDAIDSIMVQKAFGDAGARVVIEERLVGEEVSFIAICDGEHLVPLASSQDHKPAFDNDQGPNTGGMGAYSPAPVLDEQRYQEVLDSILYPLVGGLRQKGIIYRGVLYAGLMITDAGPKVLEFNVRMGDPETQPLLMRLKSDIVPVLLKVARGESIKDIVLEWEEGPSVCVVMASGGYPGSYEKGKPIDGISSAEGTGGVKVFHAGTKLDGSSLVSAGGRVLGVTALGVDLPHTIQKAYDAVSLISFEGVHYRKDIGQKALERLT
ncbi:MAG: phosphoribosylamine--glycine ligase [Deltaproteobacteria bacterium]|nr:phosphoribosylamine--glycine ligase [Deltaproteobacteria bacterium]